MKDRNIRNVAGSRKKPLPVHETSSVSFAVGVCRCCRGTEGPLGWSRRSPMARSSRRCRRPVARATLLSKLGLINSKTCFWIMIFQTPKMNYLGR